jgi:hypothetical protein
MRLKGKRAASCDLKDKRLLEGGDQWIDRALPTKPERIARPGYEIPLFSRLYERKHQAAA